MKKITELKKTIYTTKESKNALGQRIRTKVPIEVNRKVKTIQGGARFGHYIIDLILILVILYGLAESRIVDPIFYTIFSFRTGTFEINITLGSYIILIIYYVLLEATLGRTIGKFVTNSYVIDEYGNKPEFSLIVVRNLCRMIPFYALSCLGERGWHDKISKTFVVEKKEWDHLKKLQSKDTEFTDDSDILDA